MKKIFYQTEFTESRFKNKYSLDLISIALVKESGETYQAICKDYDYENVTEELKENLLPALFKKMDLAAVNYIDVTNFNKWAGKTKEEIEQDLLEFIGKEKTQLYSYYGDFDHVVLTSLFKQYPSNLVTYTKDLQQILDGYNMNKEAVLKKVPLTNKYDLLEYAKWIKEAYIYSKKEIDNKKIKESKKEAKTETKHE
jgi:hypothetical protein